MKNKTALNKFIIIRDLNFSDFMKDEEGNIKLYDTEEDALLTCGMYEFDDVLVCQVVHNYIDEEL